MEKDKTSKEIASILKITPQAYGNIERGESDICITRLILLAEYYQKPLIELIPIEYRSFDKKFEIKDSIVNGKTLLSKK